ncbi:MAG: CBS domain-containing protein [Methylococcales bacterium]|jgi:acetoin utilization protein AcuB|nr:CBS domain-containing protein [Methylococcales bacterium]
MFSIWDRNGNTIPYNPNTYRVNKISKIESVEPNNKMADKYEQDSLFHPDAINRYQHVRDQYRNKKEANVAQQIMSSPIITLQDNSSLDDAWQLINQNRFRHIPVLSIENKMVGILSDRDFFKVFIQMRINKSIYFTRHTIKEIMTTDIITANIETDIRLIANTIFQERIGSIPIINHENKLVGIITRSDILQAVINNQLLEALI